jgi:hypothetical protein
MSQETDRIPVPTNGTGPHPVETPWMPADDEAPPPASVVFTPTQLAVGFGIIASLVLLAVGRIRRRSRSRSAGFFGRR